MEQKYPSELSGAFKNILRWRVRSFDVQRVQILRTTTGVHPTRTAAIHELLCSTTQRFDLSAAMISHDMWQVFEVSDRVTFMYPGKMELAAPCLK